MNVVDEEFFKHIGVNCLNFIYLKFCFYFIQFILILLLYILVLMAGNCGKFYDRNPTIIPAGKSTFPTDNVGTLIKSPNLPDQCCITTPIMNECNQICFKLPPLKCPAINKGYFTRVRQLVQPEKISNFEEFKIDAKESIYDSSKNRKLGKQRKPLSIPENITITSRTYGKESDYSYPVYCTLCPEKKPETPIKPDLVAKQLNRYPGFNKCLTFGQQSGMDISGNKTKKCFSYIYDPYQICVIGKAEADLRERTKSGLGKVNFHDENIHALQDKVTFGKPSRVSGEYIDDIIKANVVNPKRKEVLACLAYLNSIRRMLKKRSKKVVFYDLIKFVNFFDNNDSGCMHETQLFQILANQNIRINVNNLKSLLKLFNLIDDNNNVDYKKFIVLLDVRTPIPELGKIRDIPIENCSYSTSYQAMHTDKCHMGPPESNAVMFQHDGSNPFAMSNLSSETTVEALISPNIYTIYGLCHRDLYLPRSKDEIYRIFTKVKYGNVNYDENFDQIWNECVEIDTHPEGMVCVQTFKDFIDCH